MLTETRSPAGTKSLPEPVLTSHQGFAVAFTSGQLQRNWWKTYKFFKMYVSIALFQWQPHLTESNELTLLMLKLEWNIPVLWLGQYRGCWCLSDTRSQSISSYGILGSEPTSHHTWFEPMGDAPAAADHMFCKEKCLFSPRALVRGIPARAEFAPENWLCRMNRPGRPQGRNSTS